jgi:hypothetical protein
MANIHEIAETTPENNTSKVTGISVPPNPKTKHDKNKCDHNPERESLTKYQTIHSS